MPLSVVKRADIRIYIVVISNIKGTKMSALEMKKVFIRRGLKTLATTLSVCGYRDIEGVSDSLGSTIETLVENSEVVKDERIQDTYAAYCILHSGIFDDWASVDTDSDVDGHIRFLLEYADKFERAVSVVTGSYYHKDLREPFFAVFSDEAKEVLELRAGTLFNYGC